MKAAIRHVIAALLTITLVGTLTFFLVRLAPGGPFDTDRVLPPEIMANIQRHYGLDRTLGEQYLFFVRDAIRGDFHESFQYMGRPVNELLREGLAVSLPLGVFGLLLAIGIGIPLGTWSAWRQGSPFDLASGFLTSSGLALPGYLVASLLVLVFSTWLDWLPPALWEGPSSIVLPAIALSIRPAALIAQMSRASLLEALRADYVRTAFAKGLLGRRVLFHHALRNSLVPVLTLLGPVVANLVTGSFIVEVVFQLPGIGKHFVTAVLNRDYPLVTGITILYGAILVGSNLMSELACTWADPRARGVSA